MPKVPLYLQILASMAASICFALLHAHYGWPAATTLTYLTPLGEIFINSLKMVVVPLIFTSLIVSIGTVKDVTKLSKVGGTTVAIYAATTAFAVSLGLLIGNLLRPGTLLPKEVKDLLISHTSSFHLATQVPTTTTAFTVPDNLFKLLMDNKNLLQIVVVATLAGAALVGLPQKKQSALISVFEALRDLLITMMQWIMRLAPIGVFSIMGRQLITINQGSTTGYITSYLLGLLPYIGAVLGGLGTLTFLFYPLLAKIFAGVGWRTFIKTMRPAQLMALSTSSSTLALPISIAQVEKLGVPKAVSNFVLPLGAAVNVDGTALYQGVATLFIAQAFGVDLSLSQQLGVVLYVTLSSIGIGGVPSASLASQAILIERLGIPVAPAMALLFPTDRLLDMVRSATNITGDATVAVLVGRNQNQQK